MSTPITLSGLASGLDTTSLVQQLTALQQKPITKVQGQQSVLQAKQDGINRLNTKLTALEATAVTLSDQAKIALPAATSSATGTVTVTADGSASQGTYDVRVASLAKAERSYSASFSDKDTAGLFGAGTLKISVGGSDYNIDVTAADTLSTLADKINSATGDVQASVFDTGSGFHLQVAGANTGANNAIDFTETGTTLGLSDPGAEVVSASDAKASIDGFVVTSHTNTLSNVLSGLTVSLQGTTDGATYDTATNKISGGTAATVTVKRDATSLKSSITSFVAAYNDVVSNIATLNGTSPDPTLLTVISKMRTALRTTVSGLGAGTQALSQIGIATNKDGSIRLDDTTFNKKVTDDFSGIVSLFADSGTRKGVADAFKVSIDEMQRSTTGLIAVKRASIDKTLLKMADQIDKMNTNLDAYTTRLKAQFSAMETAIAKLNSQGASVASALSTTKA